MNIFGNYNFLVKLAYDFMSNSFQIDKIEILQLDSDFIKIDIFNQNEINKQTYFILEENPYFKKDGIK